MFIASMIWDLHRSIAAMRFSQVQNVPKSTATKRKELISKKKADKDPSAYRKAGRRKHNKRQRSIGVARN